MSELIDLSIGVPRIEVLRYMGYPRARQPSCGVQKRIEQMWPQAEKLVRARGAWHRAAQQDALDVGLATVSDSMAFGVCTIGAEIECASEELGREGDAIGALFFDAFGSAAAESAAETMHARICAQVQAAGMEAVQRVSPGYGSWHVRRQRDLLARLPCESLGITLTEGCMMIPRKSVSFAVLFGPAGQKRHRHRCAACALVDCRYRLEAPGEESPGQEPEQT